MRRIAAVGLALLLGASGSALAQPMPRSQWAAKMREVMPGAFCQEGSYFRACFSQSAAACRAAAADAMDACLRQYDAQMPESFRTPGDGGRWGRVVGACAGTRFEASRRSVKIGGAKCSDPKAWQ
jgi:hypothetical protein